MYFVANFTDQTNNDIIISTVPGIDSDDLTKTICPRDSAAFHLALKHDRPIDCSHCGGGYCR